MQVEEILAANPDINSDTIKPGQKIKLQSVKTLITTVTREKKVYTETVPYETVTEESKGHVQRRKKNKTKGAEWREGNTGFVVRENGTEVSREKVDEKY